MILFEDLSGRPTARTYFTDLLKSNRKFEYLPIGPIPYGHDSYEIYDLQFRPEIPIFTLQFSNDNLNLGTIKAHDKNPVEIKSYLKVVPSSTSIRDRYFYAIDHEIYTWHYTGETDLDQEWTVSPFFFTQGASGDLILGTVHQ